MPDSKATPAVVANPVRGGGVLTGAARVVPPSPPGRSDSQAPLRPPASLELAAGAVAEFERAGDDHSGAMDKTVSRLSHSDFKRYEEGDIEAQAIQLHTEDKVERSNRLAIANFLESHRMTLINLFLIIIDVVAVACELMLANVCEVGGHSSGGESHSRALSGGEEALDEEVSEQNELVHHIEAALHWTSVSILIVFLIQQLLLMYALGRGYCRKYAYMVDFVVVVVALVLETAISSTAAGFIVLLLAWRAVRLLHGIFVSVESEHHTYHKAMHKADAIHHQLVERSSYLFVMAQFYRMRNVGRRVAHALEASYRPRVFFERAQAARDRAGEVPMRPRTAWPRMSPAGHLA